MPISTSFSGLGRILSCPLIWDKTLCFFILINFLWCGFFFRRSGDCSSCFISVSSGESGWDLCNLPDWRDCYCCSVSKLSSLWTHELQHARRLKCYHRHVWDYWYFSWQSWIQFAINPAWRFAWCTLFPLWLRGKESACSVETWVPSLGWEDPLDRGAWQATVRKVAKSHTWLKWLSMHIQALHIKLNE